MKYFILMLFAGLLSLNIPAQTLYGFQLEDINGELVSYDAIRGEKVTVIDFWATWCKPCVNSIPKLVELSRSYDDQVAFIGISIDSPRNLSKVKPFAESKGIDYPVLLDINQEVMRDLNISSIPTLLIVNSKNEVVAFHEGFAPGDEHKIKEEIDALLND